MTRKPQVTWTTATLVVAFLTAGNIPAQSLVAAQGAIIYKAVRGSDDSLAKPLEFTSVEVFPQVVNYVPVGSNTKQRVMQTNVVAVVEFPNLSAGTYTTDAQFEDLRKKGAEIKAHSERYPATKTSFDPVIQAIAEALSRHQAGEILTSGKWTAKSPTSTPNLSSSEELTITKQGGVKRTFKNVKVVEILPDGIAISHSAGAATIAFEELPQELQKKFGFDPAKAAEFREQRAQVAGRRAEMAERDDAVLRLKDRLVGGWGGQSGLICTKVFLRKDGVSEVVGGVFGQGQGTGIPWEPAKVGRWQWIEGYFTDTGERYECLHLSTDSRAYVLLPDGTIAIAMNGDLARRLMQNKGNVDALLEAATSAPTLPELRNVARKDLEAGTEFPSATILYKLWDESGAAAEPHLLSPNLTPLKREKAVLLHQQLLGRWTEREKKTVMQRLHLKDDGQAERIAGIDLGDQGIKWEEPLACEWQMIEGRFTDTGERYQGFHLSSDSDAYVYMPDGTIAVANSNSFRVRLFLEDRLKELTAPSTLPKRREIARRDLEKPNRILYRETTSN